MSGRPIQKGATDVSTVIRMLTTSSGQPFTTGNSSTTGIAFSYMRLGAANVSITLSDLSDLTDAHSDGGILHISSGYYRLDVPDAAFVTGASEVLIHGSADSETVIAVRHPLVDYDPEADIAAILVDTGTTIPSLISGASGSGADSVTINIKEGGNNIGDASVWVSTDAAGSTIVAGTLRTDSSGNATFLLDAGSTYYLWMQKDGVNPIKGEQFTATAD